MAELFFVDDMAIAADLDENLQYNLNVINWII